MLAFLLWLILAVLAWPLALLALLLYPLIWLLSIPLRLVGVSVKEALDLVGGGDPASRPAAERAQPPLGLSVRFRPARPSAANPAGPSRLPWPRDRRL